jgi:transcriptional regulator
VYIPEHFRVRDHAIAIEFMRANPFTILISCTSEGPFATHVPVVARQSKDQLLLRGHVAKANPHWKYLQENPAKTLVLFHGPHAYISPTNYETREVVPTWNYGTVHAYGTARIFSTPEELLGMLHELIPKFEAPYADQWASLSQAYRERMLSHIVGFEIAVTRVEAKFKLSQNRTKQEQQNIIESLDGALDTSVSGAAKLMREIGLGIKKTSGDEQ